MYFYIKCKRCHSRTKQQTICKSCGEEKYIERISRRPVFRTEDPIKKEKRMFVDKNGKLIKVRQTSKLSGRPFNLDDVNQQCSICMGDFEKGNQIKETSCRHKFHAGCLQTWLQVKQVCPECRMPLERSSKERNNTQQSGTNSC